MDESPLFSRIGETRARRGADPLLGAAPRAGHAKVGDDHRANLGSLVGVRFRERAAPQQSSTVAFHTFWRVRNGYPPVPFSLRVDALWLWTVSDQFSSDFSLLRYPLGGCFTALALLGFAILWR